MQVKKLLRLLVLNLVAVLILSACSTAQQNSDNAETLSWCMWGSYENHKAFYELLHQTYPEIELELISYQGANRTGYSWAQMRANDIPDIYITSQILDEELAKKRLVDLSNYGFINNFSDKTLAQLTIDGGVYLLPINYGMYGIYYNKTLLQENGWEVPTNFSELEILCEKIQKTGLTPGIIGTKLTGNTFSAVFNLAKTDWLTTPTGIQWEQNFLAGNATAKDVWPTTMEYVQRYIDIGMFHTDPEDRNNDVLLKEYLGGRKALFFTSVSTVLSTTLENGDELGMMPYISKDGNKNIYMYNPSCYFGISKQLTEPGNEKKLENAIKILELIFSPEGQQAFLENSGPCVMSALNNTLSEDSLIYNAQQALRDGRAIPMTYAHWENVLADIGQAYKNWFRNENEIDGKMSIALMDKFQQEWLNSTEHHYFCESTANFTQEETARLVAKALGSSVNADAAIISLNELHENDKENPVGVSGKQYAEQIDFDRANIILPAIDGEYAIMTMTGAEAKALAETGFDKYEDGNPFPYVLVTKGDDELVDDKSYDVVFSAHGYTDEVAKTYNARIESGSISTMLREWLEKQETVSPDNNPWE